MVRAGCYAAHDGGRGPGISSSSTHLFNGANFVNGIPRATKGVREGVPASAHIAIEPASRVGRNRHDTEVPEHHVVGRGSSSEAGAAAVHAEDATIQGAGESSMRHERFGVDRLHHRAWTQPTHQVHRGGTSLPPMYLASPPSPPSAFMSHPPSQQVRGVVAVSSGQARHEATLTQGWVNADASSHRVRSSTAELASTGTTGSSFVRKSPPFVDVRKLPDRSAVRKHQIGASGSEVDEADAPSRPQHVPVEPRHSSHRTIGSETVAEGGRASRGNTHTSLHHRQAQADADIGAEGSQVVPFPADFVVTRTGEGRRPRRFAPE